MDTQSRLDVPDDSMWNEPETIKFHRNCGIPLQKGQTVTTEDGITFTPDMVLGAPRKGIKVTYCTDTRPTENIVKCARHSDLFICEGMYAEKDKIAKAKQYKHMTFYEAADMAKRAGVEEMWLTHFHHL